MGAGRAPDRCPSMGAGQAPISENFLCTFSDAGLVPAMDTPPAPDRHLTGTRQAPATGTAWTPSRHSLLLYTVSLPRYSLPHYIYNCMQVELLSRFFIHLYAPGSRQTF